MDVIVISAEVGLRKPMREIFDMTAEKLGVAAAECVFVDDHPGHLKAARDLGWITVLHHTVPDTLKELERLFEIDLVIGS